MPKPQPINRLKGFRDILPEDWHYWEFALDTIEDTVMAAGFERADVPVIEKSDLFARSVGEETDIVGKEMYTFDTSKMSDNGRVKDKTLVSLRPEFTAGIVRAYIENGMHTFPKPVSLYAIGKCFRHAFRLGHDS